MAFSSTRSAREVAGGLIHEVYDLDFASVTSGDVSTGLKKILHASFNNVVTEASGLVKSNSDGSTTVNGQVNVSSVTSDDTGTLYVVGLP